MIWVKICGTTNLEDALASAEAGADALGFIFAPSPRRISPRDAAKIIRELPPQVERIGVFVNQKPDIIRQTVEEAALTGIQLHGDEDAAFIGKLKTFVATGVATGQSLRIIKAIRARDGFEAELAELGADSPPDLFLLDSGSVAARGGTGKRFDWEEHAAVIRLATRQYRIVVAGGLTPSNVAEAVAQFRPFGVDVVSGVEREPGRKDHAKLRAFVQAARAAIVMK
jgi:phosphoribosylanthranilate isomerase